MILRKTIHDFLSHLFKETKCNQILSYHLTQTMHSAYFPHSLQEFRPILSIFYQNENLVNPTRHPRLLYYFPLTSYTERPKAHIVLLFCKFFKNIKILDKSFISAENFRIIKTSKGRNIYFSYFFLLLTLKKIKNNKDIFILSNSE